MARVALIRTPIIQPKHHVTGLRAVPSIGIAYINAALTEAGHQVRVIDAVGEALFRFRVIQGTELTVNGLIAEEICARIPEDTDVIGVSVMHANEWIYDKYIIQMLNHRFPRARVFVGGENATGMYGRILGDPEVRVSLAVLGEADETAPLAVEALLAGRDFSKVPGIAYVDASGRLIETPRASNIRKPDALPFPNWDGIPLEKYFEAKTGISSHSERSITMVATRGCPHACTFCTVPNMWNSKWFPRSPENVIEEIESYIRRFAITHVDFVDLTFAMNRNWTEKFCDLMIEKNLGIRWSLPIGTRTEPLTPELLKKMRRAGCLRILFSPESGSKLTLRRINKKLDISDMNNAITGSIDAGLVVKLATIFGFPGQTKKEVLTSLWFIFLAALKGVHDVVCLNFVPYPGTVLHDQLVAEGKVIPEKTPIRLNNDLRNMTSWSEHIPKWAVRYICLTGMALFYGTQFLFRPWRAFAAVYCVFVKKSPVTNFESLIYNFFYRAIVKIDEVEELDEFPGPLGAKPGIALHSNATASCS